MSLLAQAKAAAASGKLADQGSKEGGFVRERIPAGPCYMRFVGYIEIGAQPQRPFQGKPKPPAREAWLEFQLFGAKHTRKIETDGEERTVYNTIRLKIALKGGERSNSYKLLKAMSYGREIKHFVEMLGEGFRGTVVHADNGLEGADRREYENLRNDQGYTISAPVRDEECPETGDVKTVPARVPEATHEIRLLLWDQPSIEQWESIYIAGERTRTVDGKEVTETNNWLQERCEAATDWEGSALQNIVAASAGDLPELPETGDIPEADLSGQDFDDEIPF